MKIIALRGESGQGKTSTLIRVYENLKKHGRIGVEYEVLSNDDFRAILIDSNGILTGIVSPGDYSRGSYSIKNHLKWYEDKGCSNIVCACTLSPHKESIENYISFFPDHCFIDKTIEADTSKQALANEMDAPLIETHV